MILVVEDEPAILELLKVNLVDAGYEVQRGRGRRDGAGAAQRESLPDLAAARLDAARAIGPRVRKAAARRRAHEGAAGHHGDRAYRRGRPGGRARSVGRRLRHQAVLAARAQGADQIGAAPACAGSGAGAARRGRAQARPVDAPRDRQRPARAARPDRVPAAALPAGPPRARPHARAAARPGLGRSRLHRGAHRRRPHSPAPPRAGAVRARIASSKPCAAAVIGWRRRTECSARPCAGRVRCSCKASRRRRRCWSLAAVLWGFAGAAWALGAAGARAGARSSVSISSISIASRDGRQASLDAAGAGRPGAWRAGVFGALPAGAHAPRPRARPRAH